MPRINSRRNRVFSTKCFKEYCERHEVPNVTIKKIIHKPFWMISDGTHYFKVTKIRMNMEDTYYNITNIRTGKTVTTGIVTDLIEYLLNQLK